MGDTRRGYTTWDDDPERNEEFARLIADEGGLLFATTLRDIHQRSVSADGTRCTACDLPWECVIRLRAERALQILKDRAKEELRTQQPQGSEGNSGGQM